MLIENYEEKHYILNMIDDHEYDMVNFMKIYTKAHLNLASFKNI